MTKTPDKGMLGGLSGFLNASSPRPTHLSIRELLQIANTLGIDVDVSTLRYWQRHQLVPAPVLGPSANGRGTRGYYDQFLLDRLSFIRQVQRNYGMRLGMIREELERIDKKILQSGNLSPATQYKDRLDELRSQREIEIHRFLFAVVSKALDISSEEIAVIVVRKKNGETIRLTDGELQTGQDKRG